jgi:hypothetical protein
MPPCCADAANLSEPVVEEAREGLTVRTCAVCGRRHFELAVDPLVLSLREA